MIALDQTWGTLLRVRRALVCLLLATGACSLHVAGQGESILTQSKEGTLVVNYYSSAPDPELELLWSLPLAVFNDS